MELERIYAAALELERQELLKNVLSQVEDVPDAVVDCAIIVPSPFLSEGVISMEDVPPVDSPQDLVDELHLRVNDKLQVVCVPYTPSFKRSLDDIYLLEFDGADQDKEGSEFKKKRCMENTCAREGSLCSRRKLLDKDEWFELWTVHSGRYKLLHDPGLFERAWV